MLDFEDVTPRKRGIDETKEEAVETLTENTAEEVQEAALSEEEKEQRMSDENEKSEQPEANPSPGVREYHYEEQVKKAPKKKNP